MSKTDKATINFEVSSDQEVGVVAGQASVKNHSFFPEADTADEMIALAREQVECAAPELGLQPGDEVHLRFSGTLTDWSPSSS